MKEVNCVIADDELLARSVIEGYVSRLDGFNVIALCANGAEIFNTLLNQHVDLVFLDIRMPHINGMDLLKTIPNLPPVILTTAYSEYALESYQFNVVDYLVKPIPFERFLKSIQKFNELQNRVTILPKANVSPIPDQPFIFIRSDKKMVKVFYNDILYFEGLKDYVQVYLINGRKIITYQTLNHFQDKLPSSLFLRVHRSYLVSINAINAFTASVIEINGSEIPIGDVYKKNVSALLRT